MSWHITQPRITFMFGCFNDEAQLAPALLCCYKVDRTAMLLQAFLVSRCHS